MTVYVLGRRHWVVAARREEHTMTKTVPVLPGIDMSRALGSARLTKDWLREYLRANPEKDFANIGTDRGAYVNGEDCIRHDLTLEVRDRNYFRDHVVALVVFQPCEKTDDNPWGYQAVVR